MFDLIYLFTDASSSVETVAGQSAQLPCNMSVAPNDTVYLVLWFKEGLTTSIYR